MALSEAIRAWTMIGVTAVLWAVALVIAIRFIP
jgi:hypothetical protein